MMTDSKNYSEEEVYQKLIQILREVAPLKVVGQITPSTSLIEDFAFDSIDMMDLLLKIQEVFIGENSEPINLNQFISCAYNNPDGRAVTVKSVCNLIMKNLYEKAV
jgi:acyl carrier protein